MKVNDHVLLVQPFSEHLHSCHKCNHILYSFKAGLYCLRETAQGVS